MEKVSYSDLCFYAQQAFRYFNTRINRIRAIQLVYETYSKSNDFGRVNNGIITINIDRIIYEGETLGYTDLEDYKGMINLVILHELSHINQYIDYNRAITDHNYKLDIELSNHFNAINFMVNREEEIFTNLGPFTYNIVLNSPHTKKCLEDVKYRNMYKMEDTDSLALYTILGMMPNRTDEEKKEIVGLLKDAPMVIIEYYPIKGNRKEKYTILAKDENGIWFVSSIYEMIKCMGLYGKINIWFTIDKEDDVITMSVERLSDYEDYSNDEFGIFPVNRVPTNFS